MRVLLSKCDSHVGVERCDALVATGLMAAGGWR